MWIPTRFHFQRTARGACLLLFLNFQQLLHRGHQYLLGPCIHVAGSVARFVASFAIGHGGADVTRGHNRRKRPMATCRSLARMALAAKLFYSTNNIARYAPILAPIRHASRIHRLHRLDSLYFNQAS